MNPTLVILAAGVGRRFGGLKQLEPLGPSGEALMDYSIFDARRAGFRGVVLVVRPETLELVRRHAERRLPDWLRVGYGIQPLEFLPPGVSEAAVRHKPWGTAHAVLAAERLLDTPFAVINADDFYGRASFDLLCRHLRRVGFSAGSTHACVVGFRLHHTLSEHGGVSRAVCDCDRDGVLRRLREVTGIRRSHTAIPQSDSDMGVTDSAIPESDPEMGESDPAMRDSAEPEADAEMHESDSTSTETDTPMGEPDPAMRDSAKPEAEAEMRESDPTSTESDSTSTESDPTLVGIDLDGSEIHLTGHETVSMNMWGFAPPIFPPLRRVFSQFVRRHAGDPDAELHLPTAVDHLVRDGHLRVQVLESGEAWFGVTHPGDRAEVKERILALVRRGVYPDNLLDGWEESPLSGSA
jgi:dTDP-glucose pyrophosphorylase